MSKRILFTHATLHTADKLGVILNGGILVEGKKISWIGAMSALPDITDDVHVHSCQGLHICPGFVEAHAHMGLYPEGFIGEPKDLNELSSPVTPQLRAFDGIWPDDIAFKKARMGGVTTTI